MVSEACALCQIRSQAPDGAPSLNVNRVTPGRHSILLQRPSRARHGIAHHLWYYLTRLCTVLRRRTTPQMASARGTQPPPPLDLDVLIQVLLAEPVGMSWRMLTAIRACLRAKGAETAGADATHCCPSAGKRCCAVLLREAPH
jgi:hypothetical protein